jgi:hypothetical protein
MSDEQYNLGFDDLLDAIPVRNEATIETRAGKSIRLTVPFRRRWFMGAPFRWLLPLGRGKTVELDPLGREIWDMIDGRTTAETIFDRFGQNHHLSFHEARLSVTHFFQALANAGAIVAARGRQEAGR